MNHRRQFHRGALAALALAGSARLAAQPRAHRELTTAAPVDTAAPRIEFVDFFWYGCPHCNAFAPMLEAWVARLPADVVVRRAPVAFQSAFTLHQRLYFTLEAMGQVHALHRRVFHSIHAERQRLTSESAILDWARGQAGLDAQRFAQLFSSFGVAAKAQRSTQLQEAYGVTGVPALGLAGRYYTDASLAGDMGRALGEMERLIDVVRRLRRG